MEVNIMNLQTLFQKPVCYQVPVFQRPYVWSDQEQWDPLWADVQSTAEGGIQTLDEPPVAHFLGAIVLQQQPHRSSEIESRVVIDGQQRLTTLQLLLDAARGVFERRGYEVQKRRLSNLVFNGDEYWDDDEDNKFKVWPTDSDQEAFKYTMNSSVPTADDYAESRIAQAHAFFETQIEQWLNERPEDGDISARALQDTLAHRLEVVVIDLNRDEQPNVIFETLNARGTPLLHSDLIKNMILLQAGIGVDSDRATELWGFTDEWWREEIRIGRSRRPRIDIFLNYWLTMRTSQDITLDNVYPEFRKYHENLKETDAIGMIASDLSRVGQKYRDIEEVNNLDISTFLRRRKVMETSANTPVILWLLTSGIPQEQIKKGLLALESHVVRRMVVRISTAGYNLLMIRLIQRLKRTDKRFAGDTIVDYLKNQTATFGRWPDDSELEDAFVNKPLYRLLTRARLRMVLEGIEEKLRTVRSESQDVPCRLTVEHIMPQQWRKSWPFPSGDTEAGDNRDTLVHSIGNLTLVNRRLNSSLSTAPWQEKRAAIAQHSTLFLNKMLIDEAPLLQWDEDEIMARGRRLFQVAISIWPYADDISA